ncbi:unnamed protein product [Closterium sp. NIES-53]
MSRLLLLLVGSAAAARARVARVVAMAEGVVVVGAVEAEEVAEVVAAVGVVAGVGASVVAVVGAVGVGVAVVAVGVELLRGERMRVRSGTSGGSVRPMPPDPGIEAAALGDIESALPSTAPAGALHTFTLDSGASRCFFRVSTTLTPLPAPVPVRLADPSGGPVLARSSTVIRRTANLQDAMVTTTTPGGQHVSICTCTRTGRHLATFTRRPGSSLYTLSTEPPQVAASAQVSASGPVAPPCSYRIRSHQNLLWHHCLGHPSLPRLRGMHSRLLVSGLSRSLPSLPPSPAPPCLPCVEGRQRAAPHSSSFPPTSAPLQTLHLDMWGPARVSGQDRERYFLLVVDDYTHYTTVFPLRSKGGEFSSDLLRDFCRGEGILQSFTLPASPQKNGIAECRIGLVMEVVSTSMIHAAAPHFLWPFAGSRAFIRDTSADKLSSHAIPCVFHGFPHDAPGWQFFHPTSRRVLSSQDVTFDEPVPFYRLFPYRTAPLPPPPAALPYSRSLSGRPPSPSGSCSLRGVELASAEPGGVEPQGAEPGGAESEGAESGGAEPGGAEPWGTKPEGAEPGDAESEGAESEGADGAAGAGGSVTGGTGAGGAGATSLGGAGVTAGAGGTGGAGAAGPRGTRTRGTGAAGAGGVGGAGAGGAGAGDPGAGAGGTCAGGAGAGGTGAADSGAGGLAVAALELEELELETLTLKALELEALALEALEPEALELGTGAAGTGSVGGAGAGGTSAGGARAGDPGAGGAGAGGAGASGPGAGGTVQRRPYFVPPPQSSLPPSNSSRPASPVRAVHTGRHVPRPRPPPVPGTHIMALRPSSVPLRVPLPPPPASSFPDVPDPESYLARAASPTVPRLLANVGTDPSFDSTAASTLVAELVDSTTACLLDYAASLAAESESDCPPSIGGECALGTDVLEDRQEDFECLAAAVPHLVAILLAHEGDPDAPNIPTPPSYAEAITGPYSSQWQTAMVTEMAFWKSTGSYVDAVPPSRANIVDGMWIFRVKRPPGSPRVFKARYVARGFSQQQGVDFFHTVSPTPKMTTLRVLLHVAAQRDYEMHSLDFSTAFLQGSLHEEIWLRRPPGFTGSFPAVTQWSLWQPVYGLCQAPREWHDTLRTTLAALGFTPSTADPSLFLRTDTSLPVFYVLVYIDDLVFATADTEALTLVKLELQKRLTCTDLGPSALQLPVLLAIVHSSAYRTSGMGLVLGGRGPVVLTGHADASWF